MDLSSKKLRDEPKTARQKLRLWRKLHILRGQCKNCSTLLLNSIRMKSKTSKYFPHKKIYVNSNSLKFCFWIYFNFIEGDLLFLGDSFFICAAGKLTSRKQKVDQIFGPEKVHLPRCKKYLKIFTSHFAIGVQQRRTSWLLL